MDRKSFLKSLATITTAIIVAPKLLLFDEPAVKKPKEDETKDFRNGQHWNYDEMVRIKLLEHKMQMERAFLFGR